MGLKFFISRLLIQLHHDSLDMASLNQIDHISSVQNGDFSTFGVPCRILSKGKGIGLHSEKRVSKNGNFST